jgi:hypothetical protein
MLLALNCFFEPVRDDPLLQLVAGFLGEVAESHLEGKMHLGGEGRQKEVELEDINLRAGERRMLVQVKTQERAWGYWTPFDGNLRKALYRFYDGPLLIKQPDDTGTSCGSR